MARLVARAPVWGEVGEPIASIRGLIAFGVIGIFVGPVLLAVTYTENRP